VAVLDQELAELAFLALDHGLDSVRASGGPLIPFVITESEDSGRRLTRFLAGTLEESQAEARRQLQALHPSRAVLAWDGYVTIDGVRTDGIFVSAYTAGTDKSLILVQRYSAGAVAVGNPARVGDEAPLY
jgi:hypothetical protein